MQHKKKRERWRVGGFPNEPCDKLEATFTRLKKEKKKTHIKPSRGQKERGAGGSDVLRKVYSELLHFEESGSVRKIH